MVDILTSRHSLRILPSSDCILPAGNIPPDRRKWQCSTSSLSSHYLVTFTQKLLGQYRLGNSPEAEVLHSESHHLSKIAIQQKHGSNSSSKWHLLHDILLYSSLHVIAIHSALRFQQTRSWAYLPSIRVGLCSRLIFSDNLFLGNQLFV